LTLEEIDQEMMRLPASPVRDEDIYARADLAMKRHEAIAAAREAAARHAAAEKKQVWGLPLVNVPAGIDCVLIPNGHADGRTVVADVVDGRRVMQLTRHDLIWLSIGNHAWTDLNQDLLAQS
jgi:hypothetical protein